MVKAEKTISNAIVPPKPEEQKLLMVSLRLPEGVVKNLDQIVEREGWSSRSELIRSILVATLNPISSEVQRMEQMEQIERAAAGLLTPSFLSEGTEFLGEVVRQIPQERQLRFLETVVVPVVQFGARMLGVDTAGLENEIMDSFRNFRDEATKEEEQ